MRRCAADDVGRSWAVSERPLALRPRLAAGLPSSDSYVHTASSWNGRRFTERALRRTYGLEVGVTGPHDPSRERIGFSRPAVPAGGIGALESSFASAQLAQLVEHFHGKEGVIGSSPMLGSPPYKWPPFDLLWMAQGVGWSVGGSASRRSDSLGNIWGTRWARALSIASSAPTRSSAAKFSNSHAYALRHISPRPAELDGNLDHVPAFIDQKGSQATPEVARARGLIEPSLHGWPGARRSRPQSVTGRTRHREPARSPFLLAAPYRAQASTG